LWQEWYDHLLHKIHGHAIGTKHITNPDHSKVNATMIPKDLDDFCLSIEISAPRNISGFSLLPGISRAERFDVEAACKESFVALDGGLKGAYVSLSDISTEAEAQLAEDNLMFTKPTSDSMITVSGGTRDWPDARGVFYNETKTFSVWVNEEDQMRMRSSNKGGNLPELFAAWAQGVSAIEKAMGAKGKRFMFDDHIGHFSSCLTTIGTGLCVSVRMLMPKTIGQIGRTGLTAFCNEKLNIKCNDGASETGVAEIDSGDVPIEISNHTVVGKSEVNIIQSMTDTMCQLVDLEKQAAAGEDAKALVAAWKDLAV
jgi:creatine kinase